MSSDFHGPLSPVGAAIGVVLAAVPYTFLLMIDGPVWPVLVAGPVAGLLLLAVPGRPRHLGTGLVASALTFPLLALTLGAIGVAS